MKKYINTFLKTMLCGCLIACTNISLVKAEFDIDNLIMSIDEIINESYEIYVEMQCEENVLFNKYDLDVYVDDELKTTIKHGDTGYFKVELIEGEHEIRLSKHNEPNLSETIAINVVNNTEYYYKTKCTSDEITIEQIDKIVIDRANEIATDLLNVDAEKNIHTINAPASAFTLRNDNVDTVVKLFTDAGFSNIQTLGIYDLNHTNTFHKKSLYEVETVSINNILNFKKREVFESTSPVVITYHDFERNDPDMEYNKYKISKLIKNNLENPMRAEDTHIFEYVELKGKISKIDPNGTYISIGTTEHSDISESICCCNYSGDFDTYIYALSKGDTITIRGKIRAMNIDYPYYLDIYDLDT